MGKQSMFNNFLKHRLAALVIAFDKLRWSVLPLALCASACDVGVWNNPYANNLTEDAPKTFYGRFVERPKYFDPARSYSADESVIIDQIYEPPLQYNYLLRPYTLEPLAASAMPKVSYLNKNMQPTSKEQASFSVYEIQLRSDLRYQPHPALAKNAAGNYKYHNLTAKDLAGKYSVSDFAAEGSRFANAGDFVHQVKRLADPQNISPVANVLAEHIVGFKEFGDKLTKLRQQGQIIDLRQHQLAGVKLIDNTRYQIIVKGDYPQFMFWLSMNFFAPMPWEAEAFYNQAGMTERNISLNWYPIGTGAFMLTENNPNLRMVLQKNPNYHREYYPTTGSEQDLENGLLEAAGKRLPFLDRAVYSLEKESIPAWNKFLQGYYDVSTISSDSFDQAINMSQGEFNLSDSMREQGIKLSTSVGTTIYYTGFNMLDPLVGGYSDQQRKLRQALSIAVDFEQYVSIFLNGRATVAQGPLPAGIFGHLSGEPGINPVVYDWRDNKAVRKSIDVAKKLLAEAGYPNGIDPKTNEPLVLYFDTTGFGPSAKAYLQWHVKQYAKLGIELVTRGTDYNRFQEKVKTATTQIFVFGWGADYPDPENFLFLFYGPNSTVVSQGVNASNYQNPVYDALFEKMRSMDNGAKRQAIIDQMVTILRRDAPWMFGIIPKSFALSHHWYRNYKPNHMARNVLKYKDIDVAGRQRDIVAWNKPHLLLPMLLLALFISLLAVGFWHISRQNKLGKQPRSN